MALNLSYPKPEAWAWDPATVDVAESGLTSGLVSLLPFWSTDGVTPPFFLASDGGGFDMTRNGASAELVADPTRWSQVGTSAYQWPSQTQAEASPVGWFLKRSNDPYRLNRLQLDVTGWAAPTNGGCTVIAVLLPRDDSGAANGRTRDDGYARLITLYATSGYSLSLYHYDAESDATGTGVNADDSLVLSSMTNNVANGSDTGAGSAPTTEWVVVGMRIHDNGASSSCSLWVNGNEIGTASFAPGTSFIGDIDAITLNGVDDTSCNSLLPDFAFFAAYERELSVAEMNEVTAEPFRLITPRSPPIRRGPVVNVLW